MPFTARIIQVFHQNFANKKWLKLAVEINEELPSYYLRHHHCFGANFAA